MGNRRSREQRQGNDHRERGRRSGLIRSLHSHTESIVPDQDPLLKSVTRRLVHAELSRDFEMQEKVLGHGYSGAVRLARHKATHQEVAIKMFSKRRLKPHRLKLLQSEVEVYLRLDHPHICRLLHAYEGRNEVWLVMELCGCELYSRLSERKVYGERDAAEVMRQMLQAINYLHSHRIVHRDLKLENWMHGATEDDRLKLIDFGFSRILGCADETLDMPCGTLHYTSPEVLMRNYTSKCDMWSLGVICYMLLLGRPPFRGRAQIAIAKAIMTGEFPREGRWLQLSPAAQDFIDHMIRKDASQRFDAAEALQHHWITSLDKSVCSDFQALSDIGVDVLKSLRKFAQGSHLRRAGLTMLAYSLTSRELQDLEETFLAFDTEQRGTISLKQLAEVMQQHVEVSTQEVERIFQSLDFADAEEIYYTPFLAAMLATRVRQHEDKVRAAFDAFDSDGTGFITAESLVKVFSEKGGLSREEAEGWIRDSDYKGNGVIDYDEFFSALTGRHLWTLPQLSKDDTPTVRVYQNGEDEQSGTRPRGMSEPVPSAKPISSSKIRHGLAAVIIDSAEEDRRVQSFAVGVKFAGPSVQIRGVNCEVDNNYFE